MAETETTSYDVLRAAIARAGEVGGHGISPEQQISLLDRLQAAEAVHDDLAAVCDAYGLPHSAVALDRHLTSNAGLTIEIWKMTCAQLEERLDAIRALDLSCELYDEPGQDCITAGSQVLAADGCLGCRVRALLPPVVDKTPGWHHDNSGDPVFDG